MDLELKKLISPAQCQAKHRKLVLWMLGIVYSSVGAAAIFFYHADADASEKINAMQIEIRTNRQLLEDTNADTRYIREKLDDLERENRHNNVPDRSK